MILKKKKTYVKKTKKQGGFALNFVLLILSFACILWGLFNVNPSTNVAKVPKAASTPLPISTQSPFSQPETTEVPAVAPAATDAEESVPQPSEEPVPEKTVYTIPEGSVAGPMPNSLCFGSVNVDNAQEVMAVIQKARDSGLLEADEKLAFTPDADFNKGSYYQDIKYYIDDSILVICWKEIADGCTLSNVEVKIADGSQIRRKLVGDTYGYPQTDYLSALAKSTNAVVAMNADYYQFRNMGIVAYDRVLYQYSDSTYTGKYKMYNCLDNCFVTADGDFLFTHYGQEFTRDELQQYINDNNIIFTISFGPVLVENGEIQTTFYDGWYPVAEIDKGYSRAGIGQLGKLHYLYMSLNHSNEKAARWTMKEFGEYYAGKGVINAYAIDGGQTSEIIFNNEIFNHIDKGPERLVSDMIYFATAIPEGEAKP